jgi:hypothetical protein
MINTIANRHLLLLGPLALLLAGGAALPAQNAAPHRFGLQASFASPRSTSFKNNNSSNLDSFLSTGTSVAGTVEWELSRPNTAFRAKAEYLSFGGTEVEVVSRPYGNYEEGVNLNYGLKAVVLGGDFLYSFGSNDEGPYGFGGLGYYITNGSGSLVDWWYSGPGNAYEWSYSGEGSGNSIGVSFGAGYRFSGNLSCEARFVTLSGLKHKVKWSEKYGDSENIDHDISISWIQASICYRF